MTELNRTVYNTDNMSKLFVTLFAPPGRGFVATLLNFCSCSHDSFVMVYAPGHPTSQCFVGQSAHLHSIKILHLDKFPAPR